nr:nucleosome assembly protein 1;3 [Ipomoea batatas]GMC86980.1 nucleosome assembly protein 1;3 [Ipomoea batatas]
MSVQNKHDEFEVEYNKEKATLDAKYQNIYYPLYEQRFKIVSGAVEGEGNDGTQNMGVGRDEDKGIPSFWLRCGARFITVVSCNLSSLSRRMVRI